MAANYRGFSLVELLVTMAIFAMLLALGAPAMSQYLANDKVRAMASNFLASVQTARVESIKRNGGAELILTSDSAVLANVDTVNLTTSGPNWIVRVQPVGLLTRTCVHGFNGSEGSLSNGANSVVVTGSATTLKFDGLGATTGTATFSFTNPAGGACVTGSDTGKVRCLDVRISASGQAQLCDPTITAVGDSRHCN